MYTLSKTMWCANCNLKYVPFKSCFFSISCISKLTRNYKQLIYNHGIHKVSFEDTHTRHIYNGVHAYTHPEQWAAIYSVAPGEQLGYGDLLRGLASVVVLKVERALDIHSPHRQSLTDLKLELATFWIT